MSLFRYVNYGRRLFDTFCNSFTVCPKGTIMKPGSVNSKFFSSAFDSCWYIKPNKLTLASCTPLVFNVRGMKVRGDLQLRCKDCYFERKDGVLYVMCSSYPRHKQVAKTRKRKFTWILTFASQSKRRPY